MLRILSILAGLPMAFVLLLGVGLYATYGEVDPCRALAVERAHTAEAETGIDIGKVVMPWIRAETSQLSEGQCARELARSWKTRLWREERAEDREDDRDNAGNPDDRARDDGGSGQDDSGSERDGD